MVAMRTGESRYGRSLSDSAVLVVYVINDFVVVKVRPVRPSRQLKPRGTDYFVLKPGQPGFHQTLLPTLLGT